MKKFIVLFLLLLCIGCGGSKEQEETLLLKCQKLRSYEFYDGTNIIGLYGTDQNKVTKVEIVENYVPKWDDVEPDELKKTISVHRKNLRDAYENLTYKIDEYQKNVTTDIIIPITEKNIQSMKEDDNYKIAIDKDQLSLSLYKAFLETNQYMCE